MKHIFELHPGAITGRLLAGNPDAGPAARDAEPDTDPVRPAGRRRFFPAALWQKQDDARIAQARATRG